MKAHFDAFISLEHAIPVEPSLRVQMNRDAKNALFRAALNERLAACRASPRRLLVANGGRRLLRKQMLSRNVLHLAKLSSRGRVEGVCPRDL
jgi:hypothetical protein